MQTWGHKHRASARTALLLILGSSAMVEGIPAFFAASRYGVALLVLHGGRVRGQDDHHLCRLVHNSTAGLQRVRLGLLERYGEVIPGVSISLVVFWLGPVI